MDHDLATVFRQTIADGLRRRTLTSCSKWAEKCIIMGGKDFPGPIRWNYYPWLKDMHNAKSEWIIGQKSAQMGYTVAAINQAFFKIDIEHQSVLYLLPTKTPDATDFSATRFDPMLESSPHLEKLFSHVKNVATKRAGSAVLYIRGANSRSGLKSIPVSFIVFDEFDEMKQENIPLAIERTSGQLTKQFFAISTPTTPGMGINELFLESTQEHFMFPCPMCDKKIELIYPESFVLCGETLDDPDINLSHLICTECQQPLPSNRVAKGSADVDQAKADYIEKGFWVPTGGSDFQNRGFYINQMYSPTIKPATIAKAILKARFDASDEQELYNSKLGLPHIVDGARISDSDINARIRGYKQTDPYKGSGRLITMGIDVGKWLHYEICVWNVERLGKDLNMMANCKLLAAGKVVDFGELDKLMRSWQVSSCVIDANPERRKAFEFACRFNGRVKLCTYGERVAGRSFNASKDKTDVHITVDRTSWMDASLGRFQNETITLPSDISAEYKEHIKAPIRVYKKDKNGNPVGIYINKAADHHAHARTYCEIALPLAASLVSNSDISAFL